VIRRQDPPATNCGLAELPRARARFGGRIAKRYLIELAVAYRHPAA
jgi:hypothetical protein